MSTARDAMQSSRSHNRSHGGDLHDPVLAV
jgi:hypothetical protein